MEKLTYGDCPNWVEPKDPTNASCIQCGRKVGKNSYLVHVDIAGVIVHPASEATSQGYWPIGRECAKAFAHDVLYLPSMI